jgi:antitoxin (DNA-binding transcriptional repressor) of toxin-antitoxin stability system
MKAITIRQLHDETGRWIRRALAQGELQVTERGKVVAKLVPASAPPSVPYFSARKLLPSFRAARLSGGMDATKGISSERDER